MAARFDQGLSNQPGKPKPCVSRSQSRMTQPILSARSRKRRGGESLVRIALTLKCFINARSALASSSLKDDPDPGASHGGPPVENDTSAVDREDVSMNFPVWKPSRKETVSPCPATDADYSRGSSADPRAEAPPQRGTTSSMLALGRQLPRSPARCARRSGVRSSSPLPRHHHQQV